MTLNTVLSEFISKKYKGMFESKGCYENVYKLITMDLTELKPKEDLRALFCYAINGDFYYRHAFCVCRGEIIEPLRNVRKGLEPEKTITIREFTFEEYIRFSTRDRRYDLVPSLFRQELKVYNENKTEIVNMNPLDASGLVGNLVKTADDYIIIFKSIQDGNGIPEKYLKR